MKLSPINNYTGVSTKGYVDKNIYTLTNKMICNFGMNEKGNWLKESIPTFAEMTNILRLQDIKHNLYYLMLRFADSSMLTFESSGKKYDFFIKHTHSNYKLNCGEIEFSKDKNTVEDISKLEGLVDKLQKFIPERVNRNFLLQRTLNSRGLDSKFAPTMNIPNIEEYVMHSLR